MENSLVLIDAGFLSKLSKYFGKGNYLRYDIIRLVKNLAKKENTFCEHLFYYTAPPFQSEPPTKEETERRERYDRFVSRLSENKDVTIREGRCQRLKIVGRMVFKQKAVDSLMVMDLMKIPIEYKNIRKIILIASDSDFVPVIEYLRKINLEVILYTHYTKKRKTNFSRSNEILKVVTRYRELTKKDFDNAPLKKQRQDIKTKNARDKDVRAQKD